MFSREDVLFNLIIRCRSTILPSIAYEQYLVKNKENLFSAALIDHGTAFSCQSHEHLLLLSDSLEKLEGRNAEAAAIVKLRFFGGLTMKQTADALGVPLRTAERNWTYARAWLHRDLEQSMADGHID